MRKWLGGMILLLSLVSFAWAAEKPAKKQESDAKRGETLYNRHCIQCHGAEAAGDGAAAEALISPVPDLRGKWPKTKIDAAVQTVLVGSRVMPGYEASFEKRDAERVMKHLVKIASKKSPPKVE